MVDFTDPADAREIANADPAPLVHPTTPGAIVLGGDSSTYWYDGRIYESDIRRGLIIWNLSDNAVAGATKLGHLNPRRRRGRSRSRGTSRPRCKDLVEIHRRAMDTHPGHVWGAHTMGGHDGRNFLTWHREYLVKLEAALIAMNPLVTIPYWDWVNDRAIPPQLSVASDLAEWGITRGTFNSSFLPSASVINGVMASANFTAFTGALEGPHGWVHGAVGGTMGTSTSPADPLFWLHHGFIDKLWADWQLSHPAPGGNPPNMSETLQPPPIMTRTVAQVQSTQALGYVYA